LRRNTQKHLQDPLIADHDHKLLQLLRYKKREALHKKSNRTLEETVSNLDNPGFLFVLVV
jgi:hypothetical protein